MVEKDLYVYLPYGYDESKDYNVIYLMHGGGEDEKYWLTEERMGKGTVALLDRMVDKGEMEPTIIVCPTFYSFEGGSSRKAITVLGQLRWRQVVFWQELRNDVIPLIETTYHTYAHGDVSEENLKATREHRGFAGFSMGSATSLQSAFIHCFDIMAYIGSYSGSAIRN